MAGAHLLRSISIGNCKVEIEGDSLLCQSDEKNLLISVSKDAKIRISVDNSRRYRSRKQRSNLEFLDIIGQEYLTEKNHSFFLLNPKETDNQSKSLLQEVLKLYMEELPAMNYAANTGKNSQFLEKCISNGKYKTLLLTSNSTEGLKQVIAAVSYQIIPNNTQYAEIPLAAVSSDYRNRGMGQFLYSELRGRLQSVGVLTIFCWADELSEGFWFKQGFVSVGKVDAKGKVSKLPIKADIRRSLCFPGGSTLMVANLKKESWSSMSPSQDVRQHSLKSHGILSLKSDDKSQSKTPSRASGSDNAVISIAQQSIHHNVASALRSENLVSQSNFCGRSIGDLDIARHSCNPNGGHSSSGEQLKRRIWETSSSSLNSKRVRCDHLIDCHQEFDSDFNGDKCSFGTANCIHSFNTASKGRASPNCLGAHAEGNRSIVVSDHGLAPEDSCPRIMLMNIADDAKKTSLTKIVEQLGGSTTSEGSISTHVITGKARRTLNFCTALCSGAWILSPSWLKASFKEGMFVGELQYILEDEEYQRKYRSELRDAVARAKERPNSVFMGYTFCLAKHIQPCADVLSTIIKSAGGNVIRKPDNYEEPTKAIFVACEEDMEDALAAARRGIRTYSSDWLMSCIMKQELDLEAPQFAESL